MSGMTATKRFIIRTSLITGSTLATILGAQSLAALDTSLFATNANANTPATNPAAPMALPETVTVAVPSPTSEPRQAEPSIVILRRTGQTTTSTTAQASSAPVVSIQPPAPVQVQAPAPVVVQQGGSSTVVQAPAPSSRPSR